MTSLDQATQDQLLEASMLRDYPARSYLFHHGDQATGVIIVEAGLLRIDRATKAGRVTLLDLAMPGDLIGETSVFGDMVRTASLSTVTPVTIRQVPTRRFVELIEQNPALHMAVTRRLAQRLHALSTQFVETATMDASARIAARLVRLVEIEQRLGRLPENVSGSIDLKLPISQEELGHWSGLVREGAVKGLATLRSIGLIETGRMRVVIHDLDELRARS